jgi:putative ABC transport system permease protein
MLKNYFKVAFRNVIRNKMYSIITITGLAIGLVCVILIALFVRHEFKYDRFHRNAGRIFRVTTEVVAFEGKRDFGAWTSPPVGPAMAAEFPDILGFVRFYQPYPKTSVVSHQDVGVYENRFFLADANVFEVFNFPLAKGDPQTALKEPFSLVVSEDTAKKYFGPDEPLGQVLRFNNRVDFVVTGVMKNVPACSHLHFDFLGSLSTMAKGDFDSLDDWGSCCLYTYVLLGRPENAGEVEKRLPAFVKRQVGEDYFIKNFQLQPLTDIHLRSRLKGEAEANLNMGTIYFFSAIALVILFIAGANFVNLSTARLQGRAREVGLRKVLGAKRGQIIRQYLGESLFLNFLALLLAIVVAHVFLPLFNALGGMRLPIDDFYRAPFLLAMVAVALVTALAAGFYPAFVLSAFQPVKTLKRIILSGRTGRSPLRHVLVLTQFAISVVLIASTLVIYRQLHFVRAKELGFDKDHVVVIPMKDRAVSLKWQAIKDELLRYPGVLKVAAVSDAPGGADISKNPFRPEGMTGQEGIGLCNIKVDYDFLDTLGIKVKEGRAFSKEWATDAESAFIINEAAAKKFGWPDPLGKSLEWLGIRNRSKKGTVVGVVKDFHFQSLRLAIEPMVLHIAPQYFDTLLVRIQAQDVGRTLDILKRKWKEFSPFFPFKYSFLNEDFDAFYRADEKLGNIFLSFSFLAIFIACLGLFGLAAYTAERRTKEIGIRKVLGASISQILFLLNRDLGKWILIANLIAWPVAYYVMNRWLQNFAYRLPIKFGVFLFTGTLTLLIALSTVVFQAVRAALANPVDSLRYE